MKVTKEMLMGDIKDFPIKVVEKMLEYQVEQGNSKNIEIFQNNKIAGANYKGFTWTCTKEGHGFWEEVIKNENFNVFFERYPELSKEVYIKGNPKLGRKIIEELEKRGGINYYRHIGNSSSKTIYCIHPGNNRILCFDIDDIGAYFIKEYFKEIEIKEAPLELTLDEIANKFGVKEIKIIQNK